MEKNARDVMKALIIGYDVRHIASSARKAGHEVLAADCYCDLDLKESVPKAVRLDCDPQKPGDLVRAAKYLIKNAFDSDLPDVVVLGPGLEEMSVVGPRILNNSSEKIAQVSDKLWLARWLGKEGYPFLRSEPLSDLTSSGLDVFDEWPVMVKPRKGAGGWMNSLAWTKEDIKKAGEQAKGDELIVQEWAEGKPASVSVVGTGKEATALVANEQLIGEPWLGATGFRYCGNLTPLEPDSLSAEMMEMAESITSGLGLVGSNGVDFLITKKGPVVLEVNPRFQGSIDSVELSCKINLFSAHRLSFDGILPERPKPQKSAGRAILFADGKIKIEADLRKVTRWVADVPRTGSIAEKGDPLISILAIGKDRQSVMELLQRRSAHLRKRCNSSLNTKARKKRYVNII